MNNFIKAIRVYYDLTDKTFKKGNVILINPDHIVRMEEAYLGVATGSPLSSTIGVIYEVDTVNDHTGHSLKVISQKIDVLMNPIRKNRISKLR